MKLLSARCVVWSIATLPILAAEPEIRVVRGSEVVEVKAVAPNIVQIHLEPGGRTTPRTPVMDPLFQPAGTNTVQLGRNGSARTLSSPQMRVSVNGAGPFTVEVRDPAGRTLVTLMDDSGAGAAALMHDASDDIYGIRGLDLTDSGAGILRNTGGAVAAGVQGGAGGPFFLSRRYAVLVDSDGGSFRTGDGTIRFEKGSRPDAEYFVIVGPPLRSMAGLALLTGRPPLPPKWTLGFLNSQWVSTEQEWRGLTDTYAENGIPVSGYIFDFDWKAWGEDDYGEWRWNSTSGEGSSGPNKFPNGASGEFAADMLQRGIHVAGILKPRILIDRADGRPTQAAAYASEHNLWYPNEVRGNDYFTGRPAANIDFGNPDARRWFWEHLQPAFRAGMAGWWNDEADQDGKNLFNNFQFMNMARALYDGQRAISSERVWSINRNYYPGAARYGYAEWSGDIDTGFQTMSYQRQRMIATLNLGEPAWSMDTGGFNGHPSAENYARWMEFAAFVPVFRVHGTNNEKRQPWVYGPVAEAAAKKVMRLRYDLMPYIYSNARLTNETGIGLVRPLFWVFPEDEKCSRETDAWMFGDALLVSPIVEQGQATHRFYLPQGAWFDYFSGKPVRGGADVSVSADSERWQDIPLYVREGSIVATQPAERGNELSPGTPLTLDVFPSSARVATFVAYDDDGHTYAYEKGDYFRQEIDARSSAGSAGIAVSSATGAYRPRFPSYILRVHQASGSVTADGAAMKKFASESAFLSSTEAGWCAAADRFGPVTEVRIASDGKRRSVKASTR